jgi:hypothetical protein
MKGLQLTSLIAAIAAIALQLMPLQKADAYRYHHRYRYGRNVYIGHGSPYGYGSGYGYYHDHRHYYDRHLGYNGYDRGYWR